MHNSIEIYSCPMHPEVRQNKAGRCPECGMNLAPSPPARLRLDEVQAGGQPSPEQGEGKDAEHGKHEGHHTADFLKKFWVALALTIPIFFYSEMAMMVFKIEAPKFPGSQYALLVLGSAIFFYCGWIFLASAAREIKAKLPGMMTLISIAITAAYLYSFFSILFGTGRDLLFELASLIAIMLLGHWIEMRSVQGAQGALRELSKMLPDEAEIILANPKSQAPNTKQIPISKLQTGDLVLVRPGARVPADGEVVEGDSDVNESLVTGESRPIEKKIGDKVIAGTINGDGSLKIRVGAIGEKTFMAGVMRLVADAQASKSRLQMLSDRAAFYLTIIALVVGGITFTAWIFAQAGIITATERLVAVLVITCPHALGLAVPLVAAISTTMAARNGLLIRERIALEGARKIDTVLFDKTGTLTKGEFGVEEISSARHPERSEGSQDGDSSASTPQNDRLVLQYAASVNSQSEHPLAKAMVREAEKRKLSLFDIKDFASHPGKGAMAKIDSKEVFVGNEAFLKKNSITVSNEYENKIRNLTKQGKTVVHVVVDKKLIGSIALADIIREESRIAVKTLKRLGIKTAMITGDSEDVAAWVARELSIDEYFARVMPDQKAEKVKLLQGKGQKVAMVGDGVNDAPALTQADLGIAIGAGTNVAIESAGIILVQSDPRDIPKIFNLSRLTYRKMIQNLFWATGYNVAAIPLAAGVLAAKGIVLEPWLAAVFMSVSTVIVAFNAILLKNQKLG